MADAAEEKEEAKRFKNVKNRGMETATILEMLKKQEQSINQIKKGILAPEKPNLEVDLEKVATLAKQLETTIERSNEAIEAARKPIIEKRKISIDPASSGVILFLIAVLISLAIIANLYALESRPNYDQRDNDLKYRYIKMKGYATPAMISDLEETFELNRDPDKIHQMLNDVETFEEAVRKKAQLDEQTRLNQLESERLDHEAQSVQSK